MAQEPKDLEQLLDRIGESASDKDEVSLDTIVEGVGRRSFGPLLLMAGVILASPLSGIPGMPTSMGVLVMLIALQLLIGRKGFWLPRWLLKRSVARDKLDKTLKWLRPPARFIDRFLRPRMPVFVQRSGIYVIGIVCVLIALGVPLMEVVPFSASGAGIAIAIFGLSLVACDGLLALLGFILTGIVFGLVINHLV